MDGFDPPRNSTAVGSSMNEGCVGEVLQELEKNTCEQMPIQTDAEQTQSKTLQSAVFSEPEKLLTVPSAKPQQMISGELVETQKNDEGNSTGLKQIPVDPLNAHAIPENANGNFESEIHS